MNVRPIALLLALAACATAPGVSQHPAPASPPRPRSELDRLVADVCAKEIVLLGEDDQHGGGRTWEIKTELVRALVDSCGFDALFIESGMYDFLALDRAYAAGTATERDLANAIGALWSEARETQPWISFIHRGAAAGRLDVMGLDHQIHSTAFYAQRELPAVLVSYLSGARKEECAVRIARHTDWTYDQATPYSAARHAEVQSCVEQIHAALANDAGSKQMSEHLAMATSLLRWVTSTQHESDRRTGFNARDRSMFENFQWHQQRLGGKRKAIVWCGNVHAAKRLDGLAANRGFVSLGQHIHEHYGQRAAAIGFSAGSGASQMRGLPRSELSVAPPESLEGRALVSQQPLRYLDTGQLRALGAVDGRPIGHKFQRAAWHEVLDGIVVLEREIPAHHDAARAADKAP